MSSYQCYLDMPQEFQPVVISQNPPSNVGSSDAVTSQMQRSVNQTSPPTVTLKFPPENIEFGTLFRFVKYDYKNQETNTRFITSMAGASIALPLPRELNMALGLSYAAVDSGVLGYSARTGYKIVDTALSKQREGLEDKLDTASGGQLSGAGSAVGSIGIYILRKMAAERFAGIENVINQMAGNVINPYNVATFQHTQSRSYRLTFTLIPMSKTDSDLIKTICDSFMYHSLPYDSSSGANNPSQPPELYLNMPDEVEIAFYGSEYLYTFARAIIDSVSINYAPGGQASFFGSTRAPTGVELSLSIREIQQLSRSAYDTQAGGYKDKTPAVDASNNVFQENNLGQGPIVE